MHIDRIEIKGFGKLKNVALSFGKGMNLIYGDNESGKTTLQWFIRAMLYGMKGGRRSPAGLPAPGKRYSPWDGAPYQGAMTYTLDNGSSFRLERDFDKNTVRIFDSVYNDITASFGLGKDKLPLIADEQLGIDEAAFENTVFIRQTEVRISPGDSSNLAARLANADSPGADGLLFQKALTALNDALKNRIGTERTRTQPLDKLESELKKLEEEHAVLAERQKKKEDIRAELAEVKCSLKALENHEQWLYGLGRLIEIRKKIDSGMKREASLKEAAIRLEDTEMRLRRLKMAESSKKDTEERNNAPKRSGRSVMPVTVLSLLCLSAALIPGALFVYDMLVRGLNDNPLTTYIYLTLTCLFGSVGALLLRKALMGRRNMHKTGTGNYPAGRDPVPGNTSEANAAYERLEALEELRRNQLSSISMICGREVVSAADMRQELIIVQNELEDLSRRLQIGLEAAAMPNYLLPDSFFAQRELDVLIYDTDTASLETEWKAESESIKQKLVEAALREKYCEGLLDDKADDTDRLQRVEEETVAVREKITYLRNKGNALKLAQEVLSEAAEEIRRNIAPELNSAMSRTISGLTGGRYSDLRSGDKLLLKTAVPDSGDVKDVAVLSGGTADQMYLALRLAVAGILASGSESLPLFMDEVFSQYDDKRTELALKYFRREFKDRQVFIFTCKKREVELAQEIFGDEMNFVELGYEFPLQA